MRKRYLIILIFFVVALVLFAISENLKLIDIRKKVYEKYGDEVKITSVQKIWKLSEWGKDHFMVYAQNKSDKKVFQINAETLENDYAKVVFTEQMQKKIDRIIQEVFGDNGKCYKVEVLGKSLNNIPSETSITFNDYMKNHTLQIYSVIHIDGYEKNYVQEKESFLQKVRDVGLIYDYISLYFIDNEFTINGR